MPFYLQMSANINSIMKHLRFSHISILTNLVQTDNKTKSVKTIYTTISIKNGKKDKE